MGSICLVELQCTRDRIQHAGGRTCDLAPLEAGVVLDAEPGDRRDLAATQPRYTARTRRGEAGLLRGDAGTTTGEELAHLVPVVHAFEPRSIPAPDRGSRGALDGTRGHDLFAAGVQIHGGPAPARRFLPGLIQLIWDRKINPGKVLDLTLPLEQAAEGYQAVDERAATKVLLTV
jgi:hypothetical protein